MALPLVFAAIGAATFVKNIMDADSNNERAIEINAKAFNRIGEAKRKLSEQEDKTKQSLVKLANRKRGIINSSMKNFLNLYEKIIKIDFEENEKSLDFNCNTLTAENLKEIKYMTSVAGIAMSSKEILGTMLFRGFGFMGGISGVIAKEAEINVSVASMRKRQANVISSQSETTESILEYVYEKSENFSRLLAKLNLFFMKSIQHTTNIIKKNGVNKKNYTVEDKSALMNCINFASAIKKVLDVPLFDENGEISEQSITALQIGEEYLAKLNQAVK